MECRPRHVKMGRTARYSSILIERIFKKQKYTIGGIKMAVKEMTVQTLTEKVLNKEHLVIFDVRNESDFQDWKIEGENF